MLATPLELLPPDRQVLVLLATPLTLVLVQALLDQLELAREEQLELLDLLVQVLLDLLAALRAHLLTESRMAPDLLPNLALLPVLPTASPMALDLRLKLPTVPTLHLLLHLSTLPLVPVLVRW